MKTRTSGDRHRLDPRIVELENIVHDRGVIGSKTVLSTLHYMAHRPVGGFLDERKERHALHVSRLVDHFSGNLLILPKTGQGCRATAVVSLQRYPDANREFVNAYVADLRALGPAATIGHALERSIPDALRQLLPAGFTVVPTSTRFHGRSNDIIVRAPGTLTFNIELRNQRSAVHDIVTPRDLFALTRDQELGRVTVFVVPMSTIRFKNTVRAHGGLTIDTNVYVVFTDEQKAIWETYRWGGWDTKTIPNAIPTIAATIADSILDYQSPAPAEGSPVRCFEPTLSLIPRTPAPTPQDLAETARGLHATGTKTQEAAAALIGCSPSALSRAFRQPGRQSPWAHGGARKNAGRKSSSTGDALPTA